MKINKVKRNKSNNYVTFCNMIMKEKSISLKAKGLYALVMSLPDDWDFSVEGICAISKEESGAIYTGLKELINAGYCTREMITEKGRFIGSEYEFFEKKVKPKENKQQEEKPYRDFPHTEKDQTNNNTKDINSTFDSTLNNNEYGNKKEENNKLSSSKSEDYTEDFLEFYKMFGNAKSKYKAFLLWMKLSEKDKKAAIEALPAYKEDCKRCERTMQYPSTYLSKRTWEDDFTSSEEEKEEPAEETQYPDGMDAEDWEHITVWMCNNVSKIAGKISPMLFGKMKEMAGDSHILALVLEKVDDQFTLDNALDVMEVFKEELKNYWDEQTD